jgi:hypothetical protein
MNFVGFNGICTYHVPFLFYDEPFLREPVKFT